MRWVLECRDATDMVRATEHILEHDLYRAEWWALPASTAYQVDRVNRDLILNLLPALAHGARACCAFRPP